LFVDSTLIYEALTGIPLIVVDCVKYDSLKYTAGKDFGVRLNVVTTPSNWPMIDEYVSNILHHDFMRVYRARRDAQRRLVITRYTILGFISSGTYGRVYKAQSILSDIASSPVDGAGSSRPKTPEIFAIKKFKPDKEGDVVTYTGISQSAIREIALNREINHENVVALREAILEERSTYMVFEYAEHNFLQVLHHHYQTLRTSIPTALLKELSKSVTWD
jgi:cyclin-dependent kinase 8/11